VKLADLKNCEGGVLLVELALISFIITFITFASLEFAAYQQRSQIGLSMSRELVSRPFRDCQNICDTCEAHQCIQNSFERVSRLARLLDPQMRLRISYRIAQSQRFNDLSCAVGEVTIGSAAWTTDVGTCPNGQAAASADGGFIRIGDTIPGNFTIAGGFTGERMQIIGETSSSYAPALQMVANLIGQEAEIYHATYN
jgi:hypothetical protein